MRCRGFRYPPSTQSIGQSASRSRLTHIVAGIAIEDTFQHLLQFIRWARYKSSMNIVRYHVANDAAEVLVPDEREKTPRVGNHADEGREQADLRECIDL